VVEFGDGAVDARWEGSLIAPYERSYLGAARGQGANHRTARVPRCTGDQDHRRTIIGVAASAIR